MKRIRLFLGVIAFTFALASALAFKVAPAAVNPAYLDDGVCTTVSVICDGANQPCVKDLGGQIGSQQIYDKQTTSCSELKMP